MSEFDECKHELKFDECSTCKHGVVPKLSDEPPYTVIAKYAGRCSECQKKIQVGDEIAFHSHNVPVHADCWDTNQWDEN